MHKQSISARPSADTDCKQSKHKAGRGAIKRRADASDVKARRLRHVPGMIDRPARASSRMPSRHRYVARKPSAGRPTRPRSCPGLARRPDDRPADAASCRPGAGGEYAGVEVEENKALMRRYYQEVLTGRDRDLLGRLLDPSFVSHVSGGPDAGAGAYAAAGLTPPSLTSW